MMETVSLGYVPRDWQRAAHLGMEFKRWAALISHRRSGKTVLAVVHMIDRACKLPRSDGRYAYIAPQLKQAKAIAWGYLKQYATKIPGTVVSEGELHVTLRNGAQIRIHGADNADALRGIYLDGVVIDEVANVSKELWDSVIRPALADKRGWALLMGTPNGINLLSETYFRARVDPQWYSAVYDVNQTNALDPEEVQSLRDGMTVTAFAREFLCDFSAAADNCLLNVGEVEAATKRDAKPADFAMAPRIMGVDVARQGDDRSVIFKRQGIASFTPQVWQGVESMQLAAHVAVEISEWQPDAVFIDGSGGYGAGVIDRLRQLGHRPIEVQFGGKADDARFANRRAEMWFTMATWVKGTGILPNIADLKQDLCAPTYGHDIQGRLLLEAKDKIKARGLPSPDMADALALTFAHPVGQRSLQHVAPDRKPYDPLGSARRLTR
ncbi:MAG: terminase family protein [Pseudomonadota bacterium]